MNTQCSLLAIWAAIVLIGEEVHAAEGRLPDFSGTWSSSLTTIEEPGWEAVDLICFLGCTPEARDYINALIEDPANDQMPSSELLRLMRTFESERLAARMTATGVRSMEASKVEQLDPETNPTVRCEPYGLYKQIVSPLPFVIAQKPDHVVFHYEQFAAIRDIPLKHDRPRRAPHRLLGNSLARYEGESLVIETDGVLQNIFSDDIGGAHSDKLHVTERYTRSADGNWLRLQLTVRDPVMLREPSVLIKRWHLTPAVELLQHSCDAISGTP